MNHPGPDRPQGRARPHPRVAMLAGARFPIRQPFAGGLEAQTWLLATELGRIGTPVDVFARAGSDPRLRVVPLHHLPGISSGARADVSTAPPDVLQDHHAYLGAMLRLQRGGFGIVHNNSVHHLPVAMASALPMPMVTTLHTPPTPWLESALALREGTAGAFVAVSSHTAGAWSHLVPDAQVIPNGIDTSFWTPGPGGGDLAWSGRIVPEKAPHVAIDAARRAGLRIRLAGPVHDHSYWTREIAPRLGPDAVWAGHLETDRLRRLLQASCAVLVTPAWDEPFGLVVLEALACGTPVAAVARGGVPELLDPGCGVLAAPGDVDGLADAVRRAVGLDRRACRRRAEEIGCARVMARRYQELYADLAA